MRTLAILAVTAAACIWAIDRSAQAAAPAGGGTSGNSGASSASSSNGAAASSPSQGQAGSGNAGSSELNPSGIEPMREMNPAGSNPSSSNQNAISNPPGSNPASSTQNANANPPGSNAPATQTRAFNNPGTGATINTPRGQIDIGANGNGGLNVDVNRSGTRTPMSKCGRTCARIARISGKICGRSGKMNGRRIEWSVKRIRTIPIGGAILIRTANGGTGCRTTLGSIGAKIDGCRTMPIHFSRSVIAPATAGRKIIRPRSITTRAAGVTAGIILLYGRKTWRCRRVPPTVRKAECKNRTTLGNRAE